MNRIKHVMTKEAHLSTAKVIHTNKLSNTRTDHQRQIITLGRTVYAHISQNSSDQYLFYAW